LYGDKMSDGKIKFDQVAFEQRAQVQKLLDDMAVDLLRRAATLDRLADAIECAAHKLDARTRDLEMREDDLLKASLEMRERRGAFSAL
jgi:hypothetical protein